MTRILFALIALAAAAPARDKLRALVLTGESDYPFHDWRATAPFLRGLLEQSGRFEVKAAEEPRGITARTLNGYDVLVLNYNGPRWGTEAERAVEDFVRAGKGMIAVHGVSYGAFYGMVYTRRWNASPTGDLGWRAYGDLLGVTWKPENIGHAARHVFTVKWLDSEHPIARGLPPAFVANDELYHRMDHKPNAKILASAYDDPRVGGSGNEEPIVWATPFGDGRTVHITLGHDIAAMYQPGFVNAFARGAEWAASGRVTLPPGLTATRKPAPGAVRALVVTGGHAYPSSFFTLFEGYPDLVWTHASSQAEAFRADMAKKYDVVVLHDMYAAIGEPQRRHLRQFVESGRGVVSLHHSIVDYTSWPWWYQEVTGGKFFVQPEGAHEKSEYKEGVDLVVRPAPGKARHPMLRGVGHLPVHDEAYRKMWFAPGITVLMETDSELNDKPVVYLGPDPKKPAAYIQLGHSDSTIRHPGFRRLVYNAVLWTAGRLE